MRVDFDRDQFRQHIRETGERAKMNLDPSRFESIAERDLRLRDLPSIPNAISLAGFAFVKAGSEDLSKVNNIHLIALGRGLDLVDGVAARFLNQSSDMGAAVDVTFDKLGMSVIAKAAYEQQALPKWVIGYDVVKHIAHTALTVSAAYNHPTESFRPPRSGKWAMFGDNLGAGLLLYANAYEKQYPDLGKHKKLRRAGYAAIIGGMAAEVPAITTYINRATKEPTLV